MAYTYFQWDRKVQQTERATLASLLRKLVLDSESLSKSIETTMEKHADPSTEDLEKILMSHGHPTKQGQGIITLPSPARFLIFIDALDEATTETRQSLAKLINRLDPRFFRILITSREDLRILTDPRLTKELGVAADKDDLRLFISKTLEEYMFEAQLDFLLTKDTTLLNTLVDDIRERANDM